MPDIVWRARLGAAAELDFANIIRWTFDTFGQQQAEIYRDTILLAMSALRAGPNVLGSKARDELWLGARTLHVARTGRRGRRLLLYRVAGANQIEVARILHDSMELTRYLPPRE